MRPGRPVPPREPGHPGTYRQGAPSAPGWQPGGPAGPIGPGGPGHAGPTGPGPIGAGGPGGWRQAPRNANPPGAGPAAPPGAGPAAPAGHPPVGHPGGSVDGGYAHVIRASDYPVPPAGPPRPPRPRRPQNPVQPAAEDPANVYVYRDGGERRAGAVGPDESDAAYWYGRREEDDQPAVQQEARGPFEPLVSSTAPPPDPAAGTMQPDPVRCDASPPGSVPADTVPAGPVARGDAPEDPARARARKLEQIKDFYLTAEAIGEENVDKHFDQLLAHQRELISEYFRQSGGGTPEPSSQEQAARQEAVPDEPFVAEKPLA